jgi:hypothetical protein
MGGDCFLEYHAKTAVKLLQMQLAYRNLKPPTEMKVEKLET